MRHLTLETVRVPSVEKLEYASLRVGISRSTDGGNVAVTLNGVSLRVPLEQCADRLTGDGEGYASCKIIELDPEIVKEKNVVDVSFPDGMPGSVGAVVIRAGFRVR